MTNLPHRALHDAQHLTPPTLRLVILATEKKSPKIPVSRDENERNLSDKGGKLDTYETHACMEYGNSNWNGYKTSVTNKYEEYLHLACDYVFLHCAILVWIIHFPGHGFNATFLKIHICKVCHYDPECETKRPPCVHSTKTAPRLIHPIGVRRNVLAGSMTCSTPFIARIQARDPFSARAL